MLRTMICPEVVAERMLIMTENKSIMVRPDNGGVNSIQNDQGNGPES